MDIFNNLFPKDLYHSYIIEGDPENLPLMLLEFLKERGDIEMGNKDVLCEQYDSFTIDDSSRIKEWHSEKGITEKKKICIIGTKFINREAERTLLKIIEEPARNTHFFIIVPNASILLDTIRSRAHIVKILADKNILPTKSAKDFITSSSKDRIELVGSLIKEYKDNENSGNLRYRATELINELEKSIYTKWKNDKTNLKLQFILNELTKSRDYLSTPGASVKMILEHIALVL